MAKTITITLNDAQARVFEEFQSRGSGGWDYLSQKSDGTACAIRITDDSAVESLAIYPNGGYMHEVLNGLHEGWNVVEQS